MTDHMKMGREAMSTIQVLCVSNIPQTMNSADIIVPQYINHRHKPLEITFTFS